MRTIFGNTYQTKKQLNEQQIINNLIFSNFIYFRGNEKL